MLGRLAEFVENPKFVILLLFIVVIGLIVILLVVITMGSSHTSLNLTLTGDITGNISNITFAYSDPDTVDAGGLTGMIPSILESKS